MPLHCPITGEIMKHETIQGVEVDVSSAGIWLDKGEFLTITEQERHEQPSFLLADLFRTGARPPVDFDRVLNCPVSGEPMQIEKLHGVHIDWSREHGVFLDKGELEAILNNLRLDPMFLGKIATRLWEGRY